MFAQYDGPKPEKMYSDIEGGLGWWRDTRFATETPKFIMGGVALNFSEWANGPGAGKGRDWKKPARPLRHRPAQPVGALAARRPEPEAGHVRRTVRLRLPAAAAHRGQEDDRREGRADRQPVLDAVPEHRQLQRAGRVLHAVLLVAADRREPELGGLFLDTRPSEPNKAVQMETQHVPAYIGQGREGRHLRPHRPHAFPRQAERRLAVVHRITAYSKAGAVGRRGGVVRRRAGGVAARSTRRPPASTRSTARAGRPGESIRRTTPPRTRRCRSPGVRSPRPSRSTTHTYGYRWNKDLVTKTDIEGRLARHPARVLPPGEGQEGQGAVGGGAAPRTCRPRPGLAEGRRSSGARASLRSPTSRPTRRPVAGRSRARRPGRSRRSWATAAW